MVYLLFHCCVVILSFFFFKQKTAYEMRISDWSSDVCSSDLHVLPCSARPAGGHRGLRAPRDDQAGAGARREGAVTGAGADRHPLGAHPAVRPRLAPQPGTSAMTKSYEVIEHTYDVVVRSEEHTSELQSLMRITYAVFCLKK